MNGTHQCDCHNFCGGSGPQQGPPVSKPLPCKGDSAGFVGTCSSLCGVFSPCPDHFRSGPLAPSPNTPPGQPANPPRSAGHWWSVRPGNLPTHPAVPVVRGSGRSRRTVWSNIWGQGLGVGGGGSETGVLPVALGEGPGNRGLGARVRLSWVVCVSPLNL